MKTKALSMLEILIVIAIFMVIMGAATTQMVSFFFGNDLEVGTQQFTSTLRRANALASNQVNDSAWGVQFDESAGTYTLFSGTGYETRTTSLDQVLSLPASVSFSSIVLNGGGTGVVFDQGTGVTSQYGSIVLMAADEVKALVTVTILGGAQHSHF